MAIDPRLREKLRNKLGTSDSQVYRRIDERAQALMLSREHAALALALQLGISVSRFATPEDLTAVRSAVAARAPEPMAAVPSSARTQPASRGRSAPRSSSARRQPSTRVSSSGRSASAAPRPRRKGRKVFVVHGRNLALRTAMFRFLRALGLEPIEWSKAVKATGSAAPYVGEVLDKAFEEAVAVVVLLTADDQARLRARLRKASDPTYESRMTGQARPNVLFEAGMAFGSHPRSTILVEVGELRPFSDIGGRHVVRLSNLPEARQELANRLETAGCIVDMSGTDWMSEGDFST